MYGKRKKQKKLMLQWYYLGKVGHLSRSTRWQCAHIQQFIPTKAHNKKCHCLNNLSRALKHQSQHDNHISGSSQSAYCLLGHFIPLFLKAGPRVVEGQIYEPLHVDSAYLKRFLWDSGQGNVGPLHSRYPSLRQPLPNDATSMGWSASSLPFSEPSSLSVSVATCWWHSLTI